MTNSGAVPEVLADLVEGLAPGVVVVDPDVLDKYRQDHVPDASAGHPLAAARPKTAEEVQTCVRWAARHRVPVVTRGAGTGLSGGARAVDGCLVLSTERMRRVRVDARSRVAHVEPGALNVEVKDAAAAEGLCYPPDPGSFRISTIGGNIATNAGGLCCVKFGVTSTYVLGLSVVLADGRLVELGAGTIKNVAGLSLTQLFVGSEGTLGVIVGARLRLVASPRTPSTVVATLPSLRAAGETVVAAGRALSPSLMELIDHRSINNVEDMRPAGLDRCAAAMLIAQLEDPGEAAELGRMAREHGATEVHVTDDPDDGEMFVEIRRATGPAVERRGALLAEDVAVPVDALPEALERIEQVGRELDLEIAVVAHAGDGNLHPAITYDPTDDRQVRDSATAFERVMRIALDLGGTITGEHGVGRTKRTMLREQLGDDVMDLNQRIKDALDPAGVLNPGAGF